MLTGATEDLRNLEMVISTALGTRAA